MLRSTLRSARATVAVASLCAALACAGSALAQSPSKNSVAYRWVDEQGVVHYGDHIPPQYANQERHVLNGQGVEVGRLDAQKTPEQLSREARERAAQIRQRQHDAFLVNTYTSVKDIEALRDVRLEQMRGQRTAAEQYVESLRSRLSTLQTRAMLFRPYSPNANARRMPDDLAENLVRTANELDTQSRALAAKSEEENSLREQFQEDIERYRALHTLHSQ
jgi:Domain of unknown function (DUF4124)